MVKAIGPVPTLPITGPIGLTNQKALGSLLINVPQINVREYWVALNEQTELVKTASPEVAKASRHAGWGLATLLLAAFMQLLDATIVTVATVPIQEDLGASFSQVQWLLAGYQLAFASGLITGGRLGDVYGRRRVFLVGVLAFTAASMLCGLAPSAAALVAFRVLQGASASLMFPQITSIIHTTFQGAARARAFGMLGGTIGLSGLAGPLIGGGLVQADVLGWGWRTIFLVNLPVGILTAVGAAILVAESRSVERPRLDLVGSVIATSGLVLLIYPIVQGREADWAPWVWLLIGASIVVLALFGLHQRARQAGGSPLVDFRLFRSDGAFGIGVFAVFALFSGVAAFFLAFAIYLQGGFGHSAWETGLSFMPIALATTFASGATIPLAARLGKILVQVGAGIMIVGMVLLMITLRRNTGDITLVELLPASVFIGAGLGMAISTLNNISLAEARGPSAGSAAGVQSTMGQIGNAVGVAVLGTLFFSLLASNAPASIAHARDGLRADLAAAGVTGSAADTVTAAFDRCLRDRASANDPSTTPESCRPAPDAPPSPAVQEALAKAGEEALRYDFSRSLQTALYYEIGVLLLTILLVARLPRRTGDELRVSTEQASLG